MAEWLADRGIGEDRAILIEDDGIVEAIIEPHDRLRAGSIVVGRLASILITGRRGIVVAAEGTELLVEPLPPRLTEGQPVRVEIVRTALSEPGKPKRAKGRIVADSVPVREAPDLATRLGVSFTSDRNDRFEAHGWSEALEEAATGAVLFDGGALRITLTPAMTLIDVDGEGAPEPLAVAGASAAARAIRRLGIAGSIGIDLPTVAGQARLAAASAIDQALPPPFERTAVNGFGFVQIVRPRARASLPELFVWDAAAAQARALLRRAEYSSVIGASLLTAAPPVIAVLEKDGDWLAALGAKLGGPVSLRAEAGLAISGGYASQAR